MQFVSYPKRQRYFQTIACLSVSAFWLYLLLEFQSYEVEGTIFPKSWWRGFVSVLYLLFLGVICPKQQGILVWKLLKLFRNLCNLPKHHNSSRKRLKELRARLPEIEEKVMHIRLALLLLLSVCYWVESTRLTFLLCGYVTGVLHE